MKPGYFLTVSDKQSTVWEFLGGECNRVYNIKGMPDSSAGLSLNTVLVHNFEQLYTGSGGNMGYHNQKMSLFPTKTIHAMYCLAGHKVSSGQLPSKRAMGYHSRPAARTGKEVR